MVMVVYLGLLLLKHRHVVGGILTTWHVVVE